MTRKKGAIESALDERLEGVRRAAAAARVQRLVKRAERLARKIRDDQVKETLLGAFGVKPKKGGGR